MAPSLGDILYLGGDFEDFYFCKMGFCIALILTLVGEAWCLIGERCLLPGDIRALIGDFDFYLA